MYITHTCTTTYTIHMYVRTLCKWASKNDTTYWDCICTYVCMQIHVWYVRCAHLKINIRTYVCTICPCLKQSHKIHTYVRNMCIHTLIRMYTYIYVHYALKYTGIMYVYCISYVRIFSTCTHTQEIMHPYSTHVRSTYVYSGTSL